MSSTEIRPGQSCGETENISNLLKENFRDDSARGHLTACVSCRNILADQSPSAPKYDQNISELARTIRDGIACSG